jgi:hypothetical protein
MFQYDLYGGTCQTEPLKSSDSALLAAVFKRPPQRSATFRGLVRRGDSSCLSTAAPVGPDAPTRVKRRSRCPVYSVDRSQSRSAVSRRPLAGRSQGQYQTIASWLRKDIATSRHLPFLQTVIAPAFSCCWLRSESHQTPVGIKPSAILCEGPGGLRHPRETFVPIRVQWVAHISNGCRLHGDASPYMAHELGDSQVCNQSDGAKAASKSHFRWLVTSRLPWLTAFVTGSYAAFLSGAAGSCNGERSGFAA